MNASATTRAVHWTRTRKKMFYRQDLAQFYTHDAQRKSCGGITGCTAKPSFFCLVYILVLLFILKPVHESVRISSASLIRELIIKLIWLFEYEARITDVATGRTKTENDFKTTGSKRKGETALIL